MDNHNILIATDFSQRSFKIISLAYDYIQNKNSKIFIVHVVEDSIFKKAPDINEIESNSLAMLQKHFPQLDKEHFFCKKGNVDEQIAYFVDKLDISLILLGSSGERSHISEFFLGSNTKNIVRNSTKPSLVIKSNKALQFKSVFIPTDLSNTSKQFIEEVAAFLPQAKLTLFNTYTLPFESRLSFYGLDKEEMHTFHKDIKSSCINEVYDFFDSLELKNEVEVLVKEGSLDAHELAKTEELKKHDLIALHTTGHFSFFAFDVIEQSHKNVLIKKMV